MEEARAFAPCHITGFFQIFDETAKALSAGSKGAGVSLSQGVETLVKMKRSLKNCSRISINGVVSDSVDVSEHLLNAFKSRYREMENFEVIVEHRVGVPLGAGFGTSGAAALSLALALNEAFSLGLSRIEAAQL
ncbi:MAG: GHMP kinase, partial [Candidatus Bathyarchaeia archaeon]